MARASKATSRKDDYKVVDNIVFENAEIMFWNFAGKETLYNRAGNRNFCVIIDDEVFAKKLKKEGWNVKMLSPKEEGDSPVYYIQVSISYKFNPPKVVVLTKKNKIYLDEESISNMDSYDIISMDLIVRPYNWNVNGKTGVKAYLKSMYVKIREDVLSEKYADFNGWDMEDEEEDDLPF